MKVTRLADSLSYQARVEERPAPLKVAEKPEKEGFQRYLQDRQQDKKDDSQDDPDQSKKQKEELDQAIEQFAKDKDTIRLGIQADLIGQGPGLKVVLKDGTGAVIRQFTGEEFIKLREAVDRKGVRGKILDQKL